MQSLADESVVVIGAGIGDSRRRVTSLTRVPTFASSRKRATRRPGESPRARRLPVRHGAIVVSDARRLRALFADFDRTPSEYYELTHLDPHYRISSRTVTDVEFRTDRTSRKTPSTSTSPRSRANEGAVRGVRTGCG
ncbi:hypothetical protein D8S78_06865 [Natrialba swarupiae]|nr:hypothetical protein [Natrialba swarupiae]